MRQLSLIFLSLLLFHACKKSSNEGDAKPVPVSATLNLPAKDEACTSGKNASATKSTVLFSWSGSADSYEVNIKNLLTNNSSKHVTSGGQMEITLDRNMPYSWFVISTSGKQSATSETWKFYNAGAGVISYAPFPAEVVSPLRAQNVNAVNGKISLSWIGSDADNDIASYDVYLSTNPNPALLTSNITAPLLNDVAVQANTTYYWKVITKDTKGNISDSGISYFDIN